MPQKIKKLVDELVEAKTGKKKKKRKKKRGLIEGHLEAKQKQADEFRKQRIKRDALRKMGFR